MKVVNENGKFNILLRSYQCRGLGEAAHVSILIMDGLWKVGHY